MTNEKGIIVEAHYDIDYLQEVENAAQFTEYLRAYKQASFDEGGASNIITPNENVQTYTFGIHPLFGRDRVFDYPARLAHEIHKEQLAHVHVLDTDITNDRKQWYSTSSVALVYSGYEINPERYGIYVLDLLGFDGEDAHKSYCEEDIEEYLHEAKRFRVEQTGE